MKFESYEEIDEFLRKELENRYEEYVLNNDTYLHLIELIFKFDGKRIDMMKEKIRIWRERELGEGFWEDMTFLIVEDRDYFEILADEDVKYGLLSDKNEIVKAIKEMYEEGSLDDVL